MAALSTIALVSAALIGTAASVDQSQKTRKAGLDAREEQNTQAAKASADLTQQGLQADAEDKAKKDRARAVSDQRKVSGSGREGTILGSEGLGSSAPSTSYQTKTLLGQ